MQRQIARSIAAQIRAKLGPKYEPSQPHSAHPEAHLQYLKGRYYAAQLTFPGYEKALVCFNGSIAIDPAYGPAYAGVADAYISLGFWGQIPEPEAYSKAKEAALRAISLDDSLSAAHYALGFTRWARDWQLAESETEFRKAIELDPNDPEAHAALSRMLAVVHLVESDALAEARLAVGLDPLSLAANANAAWVAHLLGKYDLAVQQARTTLELFPHAVQAWYVLGQVELARFRFHEATEFFEKALTISQDAITISYVGHAQARAGNRAEAEKWLQVLQKRSQNEYVIPRSLLWIYIALEDNDRAFQIMESEFAKRSSFLWWLRSVPLFEPIRSDPRYNNLVCRMGFPHTKLPAA